MTTLAAQSPGLQPSAPLVRGTRTLPTFGTRWRPCFPTCSPCLTTMWVFQAGALNRQPTFAGLSAGSLHGRVCGRRAWLELRFSAPHPAACIAPLPLSQVFYKSKNPTAAMLLFLVFEFVMVRLNNKLCHARARSRIRHTPCCCCAWGPRAAQFRPPQRSPPLPPPTRCASHACPGPDRPTAILRM